MKSYMILEGNTVSPEDIDRAMARGRRLRSEATWRFFQAISSKIAKLFHSNTSDDSGLAHSA